MALANFGLTWGAKGQAKRAADAFGFRMPRSIPDHLHNVATTLYVFTPAPVVGGMLRLGAVALDPNETAAYSKMQLARAVADVAIGSLFPQLLLLNIAVDTISSMFTDPA